ncbi:MAG: tripartite tricarboxylate transporter TctB family protein [Rhodobacteraceae bacterium]|nr:tripartite tricarboxylate transporter TctB family protein [Paracoccaceae bacterium]
MQYVMKHLSGAAGHLLLLAGFAGYAIWYVTDAWSAQAKAENLLLIGPAAVLALVVIAALIIKQVSRMVTGTSAEPSDDPLENLPPPNSFREKWGTPLSAILLAVYVLSVPFIGFDVATVTYVAICMMLQGARDWRIILPFSLLAGLLPVWAIELILSIPIPTTFL